jgi:copper chaperone CopZ
LKNQRLLFSIAPASCSIVANGEELNVEAELKIDGMHCDSCAVDIKETLEEISGVQRADVSFKGKTALIEFDNQTVEQQTLIKKLQDLGYPASIIGEPQGGVRA